MSTRTARRFTGTHPGIIDQRSNAWPAPQIKAPGLPGWDGELSKRVIELADTFGLEPCNAWLWLGYLTGEIHALPEAARR